jgi:hypothetical protein
MVLSYGVCVCEECCLLQFYREIVKTATILPAIAMKTLMSTSRKSGDFSGCGAVMAKSILVHE